MKLKAASVLLILVSFYLYFSYVGFYNFIGDKDLKDPNLVSTYILVATQNKTPTKYIALGDSLSAGVGSNDPQKTFVYQFAQNLLKKYSPVEVIDLAQPGATTSDLIETHLPQTIIIKPDYITLLIGINDIHNKSSLENFRKNYSYIINQLTTQTKARITLINLPYLGSDKIAHFPFNILLNFRTRQFNNIINSLARENNLKVVDLYNGTRQQFVNNQNLYSTDLFHPSGEGYILWSKLINAD